MIDITGIKQTYIYRTCFLRRNIVRLIQDAVARADFTIESKDVKNLSGLLAILNRELKQLQPKFR